MHNFIDFIEIFFNAQSLFLFNFKYIRIFVYRFIIRTASIPKHFLCTRNPRRLINFHNTLKLILRPTDAVSDAVYPLVFD